MGPFSQYLQGGGGGMPPPPSPGGPPPQTVGNLLNTGGPMLPGGQNAGTGPFSGGQMEGIDPKVLLMVLVQMLQAQQGQGGQMTQGGGMPPQGGPPMGMPNPQPQPY